MSYNPRSIRQARCIDDRLAELDRRQEAGVRTVERGTVKWFNEDKGFGLIAPESGGTEVFVHHTFSEGSEYPTLLNGQQVEFEAAEQAPRRSATRVRAL